MQPPTVEFLAGLSPKMTQARTPDEQREVLLDAAAFFMEVDPEALKSWVWWVRVLGWIFVAMWAVFTLRVLYGLCLYVYARCPSRATILPLCQGVVVLPMYPLWYILAWIKVQRDSTEITEGWTRSLSVTKDGPLPTFTTKREILGGVQYNVLYDEYGVQLGILNGTTVVDKPGDPLLSVVPEMAVVGSKPILVRRPHPVWKCMVEMRTETGEIVGYGTRVEWCGVSLLVTATHVADSSVTFNSTEPSNTTKPACGFLKDHKHRRVGDLMVYVVDNMIWSNIGVGQAKPGVLSAEGRLTIAGKRNGEHWVSNGRFDRIAPMNMQQTYAFGFVHTASTAAGDSGKPIVNERGAVVGVHSSGIRSMDRNLGLTLLPSLQVLLPPKVVPESAIIVNESEVERSAVWEKLDPDFRLDDFKGRKAKGKEKGKADPILVIQGPNFWTTLDFPQDPWADMVELPVDVLSDDGETTRYEVEQNKLQVVERDREIARLKQVIVDQEARYRDQPPPPVVIPPNPVDFQEPAPAPRVNKSAPQEPAMESSVPGFSSDSSVVTRKEWNDIRSQLGSLGASLQKIALHLNISEVSSTPKGSPRGQRSIKSPRAPSPRSQSSETGSTRSTSKTRTSSKTSKESAAPSKGSRESKSSDVPQGSGSRQ